MKNPSKYELTLIPKIIKDFRKNYVGKDNAVTSASYRYELELEGIEIGESRFRCVIKYIQMNGLCKYIITCRWGFYYTRKKSDVLELIENFQKREKEMSLIRKSLMRQIS